MIFTPVKLQGAFIIEPQKLEDDRGFFARTWCHREFERHGIDPNLRQCNISFNRKKGALRGMHYQTAPHEEAKLVRCTRGAIYDVIIDLRRTSATFKQHVAAILTADNHQMMYLPAGFAHGFQSLEDNTEIFYQMSESYFPECARGVRWNDPTFGIPWPIPSPILLARDNEYPDFRP